MTTTVASHRRQHTPSFREMGQPLLLAAPTAAAAAGLAAEWLDFRALRAPILLGAGLGVLATGYALARGRRGAVPFALTVALGVATWAAAEGVYAVSHAARGGTFNFEASPLESQAGQALTLVLAHGVFLGVPTGLAAAALLHLPALLGRGASPRWEGGA